MIDLRDIKEFFRDFFKYIIIFVIMVLIFTFIISFQPIAGNSMSPTLKEGQIVLVSKFAYKFSKVKRNDIVVIDINGKSYIKRVIGLPGEKIEYIDDILYINDIGYQEKFLSDNVKTNNFLFVDICPIDICTDSRIPDNMYLVLGDNRPESQDSRDSNFGLIKKSNIKGQALFKIWPINNVGKVE